MLAGLGCSGVVHAAFLHNPALAWHSLTTPHFQIHFHDGEHALAERVAGVAEQVHRKLVPYFNWQPQAPTQVLLINTVDFANGFASPLPRNTMTLYMAASDDFGEDYDDWFNHLITHEYTHVLHVDKARGGPKNLRGVLGRFELLFPNMLQPIWVLEGLATYVESDHALHIGRGQSSLYEMYMRLEWEQGLKPLRQVNLPISSWPGGNTRYLYGVYFFNFLHDRYGEEKIKTWIHEYSDNLLLPFAINSNAKTVFNKDLSGLWLEFEDYLAQRFQPVVAAVQTEGMVSGERLTHSGYVTGYPKTLANGEVYFVRNDWAGETKLMRLAGGKAKPEEVTTLHGVRYDIHPQQGILVTELDAVDNTDIYSDLYRMHLDGTHKTRLSVGGRYLQAVWHPTENKILAIKHNGEQQQLQLLDGNGKWLQTLWRGEPGVLVADPAISADGLWLAAAVWRPSQRWEIERFSLTGLQWTRLSQAAGDEGMPRFSLDGQALYFVADYNRIFNIYRLTLATGELQRISNVTGGIGAVSDAGAAGLYYMGFHAQGSDLYRLSLAATANPLPTIDLQRVPPPTTPVTEAMDKTSPPVSPLTASGVPHAGATGKADTGAYPITDYESWDKILPTAWFPFLNVDDNRSEWGIITHGSDPLNRHNYSLMAAYDVKNQWAVGSLSYLYDRYDPSIKWYFDRQVDILLGGADGAGDSLGSSKKAAYYLAEENQAVELLLPYLRRDQQSTLHAGLVHDQVRELKRQTAEASGLTNSSNLAGLAWTYNSAKAFPRSISLAQGQRMMAVAEYRQASGRFPSDHAEQVDWRGYLTLGKTQAMAGRILRGHADDARPFRLGGNFEGFAILPPQNTVDTIAGSSFDKRNYALRGYPEGLPILRGTDLLLTELEWRFPLTSIERGLMAPLPIGINRIHGNLFFSAGNAISADADSRYLRRSVGAELNLEVIAFYLAPLKLRLGSAHGLDQDGEAQVYLSLGGSF